MNSYFPKPQMSVSTQIFYPSHSWYLDSLLLWFFTRIHQVEPFHNSKASLFQLVHVWSSLRADLPVSRCLHILKLWECSLLCSAPILVSSTEVFWTLTVCFPPLICSKSIQVYVVVRSSYCQPKNPMVNIVLIYNWSIFYTWNFVQ